MQQLCSDWDPERFPEVLDGELDNTLRLTQQFTPWTNLMYIGAFGFIGVHMYHIAKGTEAVPMDYVIVLAPLLLLGLVLIKLQISALERFADEVTERIILSGLLDRLPTAPDWLGGIYDWTPAGFAMVFVGRRPNNMKGWGRVLANNLDFYLDAPRRYIKPEWYVLLAAIAVGVVAFILFPGRMEPGHIIPIVFFLFPGVMVFSGIVFHTILKKRRMVEVFRELLNHGIPPEG